jgi:hypothetical protein
MNDYNHMLIFGFFIFVILVSFSSYNPFKILARKDKFLYKSVMIIFLLYVLYYSYMNLQAEPSNRAPGYYINIVIIFSVLIGIGQFVLL